MLRKIIAASALVLALGGSAMAQSSDDWSDWSWWHHSTSSERPVDRTTTGSISADRDTSGLNSLGSTGAAGPCAYSTAGPDANAQGNVNDQYCGK
ncbi:hypothetical protein AB6802_15000 [Mesorhizobium sp. RCC_202]|jgi:hypothetical protein|uniref:hypothetical protein n=1 Tax=Mesorhizobium sp. RCC_202 TaxID=3239222 RepID=UPI003526907E